MRQLPQQQQLQHDMVNMQQQQSDRVRRDLEEVQLIEQTMMFDFLQVCKAGNHYAFRSWN